MRNTHLRFILAALSALLFSKKTKQRRFPLLKALTRTNHEKETRKTRTYGKRSRASHEDSASSLFDAAVIQEGLQRDKKVKRRVRFSDPLTEEIPDTLSTFVRNSKHPSRRQDTRRSAMPRVNRVLNFDSDDEKKEGAALTPKRSPSFIDDARWRLQRDHDPEWYPETQPDDVRMLDKSPCVSLDDENGSLLIT